MRDLKASEHNILKSGNYPPYPHPSCSPDDPIIQYEDNDGRDSANASISIPDALNPEPCFFSL